MNMVHMLCLPADGSHSAIPLMTGITKQEGSDLFSIEDFYFMYALISGYFFGCYSGEREL
jgi:hypothetical protein